MQLIQSAYPSFACASDGLSLVVIGGGGGGKNYGIKNVLQCFVLIGTELFEISTLDTGADVPTHLSYARGVWTCCFEKSALVFRLDAKSMYQFVVGSVVEHQDGFRFLKLTDTDEFLSGTSNGKVHLWSSELRVKKTFDTFSPTDPIVEATLRDNKIYCGSRSGNLRVFGRDGAQMMLIETKGFVLRSFDIKDNLCTLVLYGARGPAVMQRFDLEAPERRKETKISDSVVSSVFFGVNRTVFGFSTGVTEEWNEKRLFRSSAKHEMPVGALAVVGDVIVTASSDYTIRVHSRKGSSGFGCWMLFGMVAAVGAAYVSQNYL